MTNKPKRKILTRAAKDRERERRAWKRIGEARASSYGRTTTDGYMTESEFYIALASKWTK